MNYPSLEESKRLYQAAIAYRELACWQWMRDRDMIAVRDPETGETAYCCVMGALGECLGLAAYRGEEGLAFLDKLEADGPQEDPFLAVLEQNSLALLFVERRGMRKQALAVIKDLGLHFRGKEAWPALRSYLPGYVPWDFNAAEARFFLAILEQTCDVARRFKNDPNLLAAPEEGAFFARVPVEEGGQRVWKDQWLRPVRTATPLVSPVIDSRRLQALASRNLSRAGVWEMDMKAIPAPVGDKERSFFPIMLMCVDRRSGMVFGWQMLHPKDAHLKMANEILGMIENVGAAPERIVYRNPRLRPCLEVIALSLNIGLSCSARLPALQPALDGLLTYMNQR